MQRTLHQPPSAERAAEGLGWGQQATPVFLFIRNAMPCSACWPAGFVSVLADACLFRCWRVLANLARRGRVHGEFIITVCLQFHQVAGENRTRRSLQRHPTSNANGA